MHVYHCVAWQRTLVGADRMENTVSLLLLRFVYRAVAQQRVDELRYGITHNPFLVEFCLL
jgi:hypothetical protein